MGGGTDPKKTPRRVIANCASCPADQAAKRWSSVAPGGAATPHGTRSSTLLIG